MTRVDIRSIRREQILRATEHIVAEHGWERATFAEICKEAGVSNRVLTYHFTDKDDVLLALLERSGGTVRDQVVAATPADGSLVDAIAQVVLTPLRAGRSDRRLTVALHFIGMAQNRPDVADRLRASVSMGQERVAALIRRGVQQGEFGADDPDAAAGLLMATLWGLQGLQMALGLTIPEEAVVSMVRKYLGVGLNSAANCYRRKHNGSPPRAGQAGGCRSSLPRSV